MPTTIAAVEMSAEDGGSTLGDVREHATLLSRQSCAGFQSSSVLTDHVGQLEVGRPGSGAHGSPAWLRKEIERARRLPDELFRNMRVASRSGDERVPE